MEAGIKKEQEILNFLFPLNQKYLLHFKISYIKFLIRS